VDASNLAEAESQLLTVTQAAPKFARGWHTLGIIEETEGKQAEARAAYEHAVEADPKLLAPYVTLARICIRTKDWQSAAKDADALIKMDSKRVYPEIYLHQAVARYQLKDLDGAEASAKLARDTAPAKQAARAEFVLGRIADAKGDYEAARQHVQKFLDLDPKAPDADLIRAYLQVLGKPEGKGVEADLELP
jgi:tetratricopeptide (TPR) repeat protein